MAEARAVDTQLMAVVRVIVRGDSAVAARLLAEAPELASAHFQVGATRQVEKPYFLAEIGRHVYAGDTALHIAAAAYSPDLVRELLGRGARVRAKNRRGAEPLHDAVSGMPGSLSWNPPAQVATVACLIQAGADPDAVNKNGVTPLHVAVRTRCAAAVRALLVGGADVQRRNNTGSTPLLLAMQNSGRGCTGSAEAKAEQAEIVRLLRHHGATG